MAEKEPKSSPTKASSSSPKKQPSSPTKSSSPKKESLSSPTKTPSPVKEPQTMSTEETKAVKDVEPPVEGAAGDGDEGSWGGWFSSTLGAAKERSSEMFNYLKQDLSEFTETVQEAGREIKDKLNLEDTVQKAVTSVGTKANVIFEQMSTIFGIGPDDDDEELVMGRPTPRTRVRAKIYTMSYDESLFLEDPKDIEDYERWMSHFDLEEENEETVNLLAHNPHLQEQYTTLVPSKVSHLVFWHRFYYLVNLMLEAEKKAVACAAQPVAASTSSESEINIHPDEIIGDPSLVEISEEDQKRLLAEYEEEMKKCDEDSGRNSRRSSGPLSSSSSSSFAFVTHDASTDEVKVE